MPRADRVLFLFLDGVGLGTADPERNPFAVADLPALAGVLDGTRLLVEELGSEVRSSHAAARGVDPLLGVPGLPQSGTGQTALLTGRNAPALMGRHFGPWVPTALRPLLAEHNLFSDLRSAGLEVAFANAYPREVHADAARRERRPIAFPFAARSAGLLDRDEHSLRRGEAVVSSITTESWRRYVDPAAPLVSPEQAGRHLATIARDHHFTLFAHFDTDHVGHRGKFADAVGALERVDAFCGALLDSLAPGTLVLITSDHGNIEDASTGHTRNPVPLIAIGPGSHGFMRAERLCDVAPLIREMFDLRGKRPVSDSLTT